jgi:hypothetical protein
MEHLIEARDSLIHSIRCMHKAHKLQRDGLKRKKVMERDIDEARTLLFSINQMIRELERHEKRKHKGSQA